jgi:SAM-dependent methyltransferase
MKKITASDFNEDYYNSYCGTPNYTSNILFIEFFKAIALHIKEKLNPKTVLDAGCACGHLVAALHDLGIEAYGVDISEYAISQAREDIKPYCAVSSLTSELPENFPQKYDLVTNIEVLEHMHENDSLMALDLLCKYSDIILFSSSPDDFTEETHVNVQPIEYWVRHFAKNGFPPNMSYDINILPPQAIFFQRSQDHESLFASFATALWQQKKLNLKSYEDINSMSGSLSWKITKPLRLISRLLKRN